MCIRDRRKQLLVFRLIFLCFFGSLLLVTKSDAQVSGIYGHQLFKADYKVTTDNGINDTTKANIVKIPDSYVLGSGDKLTVSIFGESQFDVQ